jgi:hypothetical protein
VRNSRDQLQSGETHQAYRCDRIVSLHLVVSCIEDGDRTKYAEHDLGLSRGALLRFILFSP